MTEHEDMPPAAPSADAPTWQYKGGSASSVAPVGVGTAAGTLDGAESRRVEWSASEYVAHDKTAVWYVALAAGTIVITTLMYVFTREVFTAVVMLLLGVIAGVAAARKPRVVTYALSASGIKIGTHFHPFSEYKSFALMDDQPFKSIVLIPMKRFDFPLSIYLAPDNEHEALDALSARLPLERGKLDFFEDLMHRLRF